MLIVRCSACKTKLWKYDKIGQGAVLRCHKKRISKTYLFIKEKNRIKCSCGKDIGVDRGSYIKMIAQAFTCSGTKRNA